MAYHNLGKIFDTLCYGFPGGVYVYPWKRETILLEYLDDQPYIGRPLREGSRPCFVKTSSYNSDRFLAVATEMRYSYKEDRDEVIMVFHCPLTPEMQAELRIEARGLKYSLNKGLETIFNLRSFTPVVDDSLSDYDKKRLAKDIENKNNTYLFIDRLHGRV
jgi:hypothetical protein